MEVEWSESKARARRKDCDWLGPSGAVTRSISQLGMGGWVVGMS